MTPKFISLARTYFLQCGLVCTACLPSPVGCLLGTVSTWTCAKLSSCPVFKPAFSGRFSFSLMEFLTCSSQKIRSHPESLLYLIPYSNPAANPSAIGAHCPTVPYAGNLKSQCTQHCFLLSAWRRSLSQAPLSPSCVWFADSLWCSLAYSGLTLISIFIFLMVFSLAHLSLCPSYPFS